MLIPSLLYNVVLSVLAQNLRLLVALALLDLVKASATQRRRVSRAGGWGHWRRTVWTPNTPCTPLESGHKAFKGPKSVDTVAQARTRPPKEYHLRRLTMSRNDVDSNDESIWSLEMAHFGRECEENCRETPKVNNLIRAYIVQAKG